MKTTIHSRSRTYLFWLFAFIEFFERYGFYTVMALIILMLTNLLGWNDANAYTYIAGITALIYIAPLLGGWVTDRYFDNSLALLIGAIFLCIGYILLSFWHVIGINIGMGMIIIGMAFFKFAPSAMIGELYQDKPTELDRLYVIFYVSINIGALLAFFSAGWLKNSLGWYNLFLIPASGLLIASSIARYIMVYKQKHMDQNNYYSIKKISFLLLGCLFAFGVLQILLHYAHSITAFTFIIAITLTALIARQATHLEKYEKRNLAYILIMCLIAMIFFILYGEQSTLITLFAERLCAPKLFGIITIHPSAYSGFDALWILILSPVVSLFFKKYDKTASKHALMLKFGSGLIISGLGFYVLYAPLNDTVAFNTVQPLWVCLSFALQALGEILVSALGLSLMAKWAPKKVYNALMGGWFMVVAIGSCLSGYLNSHLASVKHHASLTQTVHIYQHSFMFLTVMAIGTGVFVLILSKPICKWLQ